MNVNTMLNGSIATIALTLVSTGSAFSVNLAGTDGALSDGTQVTVTAGTQVTVTAPGSGSSTSGVASPGRSKVGIFRSGLYWLLDANGNMTWDGTGPGLDSLYAFAPGGPTGVQPVTGDWSGTGTTKIGVFYPATGTWYLDYNGNGVWDGPLIDRQYQYGGLPGDKGVTGDWTGTGTTKIGIFRNNGQIWLLNTSGSGVFTALDPVLSYGGLPGDVPITGDWTGSGTTKIGIVRDGFLWVENTTGTGAFSAADTVFGFGFPTGTISPPDIPVTGDWNGSGTAKPGVFRLGFFWVLGGSNNQWVPGDPAFAFGGLSGDMPVVGNWAPASAGPNVRQSLAHPAVSQTAPLPRSGPLWNAASWPPTLTRLGEFVAPGQIVSILGDDFANREETTRGAPVTRLAGVQVRIGETPVPLFYVSPSQINAVVPFNIRAGQTTQLLVERPGLPPVPFPVEVVSAQPSVFSVVHTQSGTFVDAGAPARRGEVVSIYCTGLGQIEPGDLLARVSGRTGVLIGGIPADALFSGLEPNYYGVYRVDFRIPQGAPTGTAIPVSITVDGVQSNAVVIDLQ